MTMGDRIKTPQPLFDEQADAARTRTRPAIHARTTVRPLDQPKTALTGAHERTPPATRRSGWGPSLLTARWQPGTSTTDRDRDGPRGTSVLP